MSEAKNTDPLKELDLDLEVEKAREDLKSFGLGGDDNSEGEEA